MDFDYSKKGTVQIAMIPYSKQIEDDFPEPITSTTPAPATDHLFQVRPDYGKNYFQKNKLKLFTVARPIASPLVNDLALTCRQLSHF